MSRRNFLKAAVASVVSMTLPLPVSPAACIVDAPSYPNWQSWTFEYTVIGKEEFKKILPLLRKTLNLKPLVEDQA